MDLVNWINESPKKRQEMLGILVADNLNLTLDDEASLEKNYKNSSDIKCHIVNSKILGLIHFTTTESDEANKVMLFSGENQTSKDVFADKSYGCFAWLREDGVLLLYFIKTDKLITKKGLKKSEVKEIQDFSAFYNGESFKFSNKIKSQ